jgi:integrase
MTFTTTDFGPERLALIANRLENAIRRLGGADKPAITASTHEAYLKTCGHGLQLIPGVWGHEAAPNTRWHRRAAFRYWARAKLCDLWDIYSGRVPRFGTIAAETYRRGRLAMLRDIEKHLDAIEEHLDCFQKKKVEFPPKPLSLSKRRGLSFLPKDWRQRLWSMVPLEAPYRDAIAVLSVVGARPVEVTAGIRVRLFKDGVTLIFRINGAKVTDTQGQPIRVIRSICTRPEADHLRNMCRKAKGTVLIRAVCSPKRLGDSVSHYGSMAFPKKKIGDYSISPYSFRHQISADMKTEEIDRERIAAVLGHASTRTASKYGWKVRGSGQFQPKVISGVVGSKVFREVVVSEPRHLSAKPKGNKAVAR